VIALATGGTDLVNAVKQAAEFGLSAKQSVAIYGATVFDIDAIGLEKAQGLINAESFYWDRTEASRAFSKRYEARFGRVPGQVQAGVYSGVLHYLKSVAAAGTDDGVAVAKKMRELPVNDMFTQDGHVRADGWMLHDDYLFQVKSPAESKSRWDVYKLLATIPAAEAANPLATSKCPLVKTAG
jgi:branched-chain amino acid transport system substrate-binding protein